MTSQQYGSPAPAPPQTLTLTNINQLFFYNVENVRLGRLLTYSATERKIVYSSAQFGHAVLTLRGYLKSSGLVAGDRVAILSENRPEWSISDFAILLAKMVTVPVYVDLLPAQARLLLTHSRCRAILVSGEKAWTLIREIAADLTDLSQIIALDDTVDDKFVTARLAQITQSTESLSESDRRQVRAETYSVDPDTLATIVYTSGTTGTPKGVMLSHGNIMFDLERCVGRLRFHTATQALSVLPLSHMFERLMCYGYFRMALPIAYGDPHTLKTLLKEHRPGVMGCVPRIMEKIRESIEGEVHRQPPKKQKLFQTFLDAALACTRRTGVPEKVNLRQRCLYVFGEKLVFAKIREQLGGLKYMVCGGAWLNPAVEDFFRALGISVLQGYGLTETSPVITLTRLGHERTGSVGSPLEGVDVKIEPDGEILTRGPHVMHGYYLNRESTRNAFIDGWFRTGDFGQLDSEGNLRITGRLKDILVLSTGKNVNPTAAEEALSRSRFVQNVFGVGDGRKYLCALIVPHRNNIEALAQSINIEAGPLEDLLKAPEIQSLFRDELASCQGNLAPWERAKRFAFLSEDVMLDPELMTPTQKVRRAVLEKRYAEQIEGMYLQEERFDD